MADSDDRLRGRSAGSSRPPGPGRRRAVPAVAQQRLMARIAATRRARQRRMALTAAGMMSALVLLVAGGAWGLSSYVNAALRRVDAGVAGDSSGPLNILLAGVDERSGLTRQQQSRLHVGHDVSTNSDTMMLVHMSGDRRQVTVVSLPRDSWVDLPGHGMNKINSAFGLGGPKLAVATVEHDTGLTINDFVQVNFLGFIKVIDALGGVDVCLPQAVDDPYSGLRMSAGVHHVNGITALEYARDRHSFALSDLSRIQNQQSLMASLLNQAISSGTLANPLRLRQFMQATLAAVKVNRGMNVTGLADQLHDISAANVRFLTVPLASTNYQTPTGESAVLWNTSAANRIWGDLRSDQPVVKPPRQHQRGGGPRPGQVHVAVYNGTMIGGLSAGTGAGLSKLGFRVRAGLTWPVHDVSQTVIEYPPGQQAAARLVQRRALHGGQLRQLSGLHTVRVVLGTNGYGLAAPSPGSSSSGGGGSTGNGGNTGRTAAQAACH